MHRNHAAVSLTFGLLFATALCAQAGHEVPAFRTSSKEVPLRDSVFDKGSREFQALTGAFVSINHAPELDYAIGTLRVGWMLNTPQGEGFFRGNAEFLLEAFGAGIYEGPGSFLAGGTLLLRYNFVQPEARLVPYVQIGAGGLYSDAYQDESQRLIGSAFEFNLQGSVGVRWFLSERCALAIEGGYRHISNANLADRNTGVDSIGAQIGFSYFF